MPQWPEEALLCGPVNRHRRHLASPLARNDDLWTCVQLSRRGAPEVCI